VLIELSGTQVAAAPFFAIKKPVLIRRKVKPNLTFRGVGLAGGAWQRCSFSGILGRHDEPRILVFYLLNLIIALRTRLLYPARFFLPAEIADRPRNPVRQSDRMIKLNNFITFWCGTKAPMPRQAASQF